MQLSEAIALIEGGHYQSASTSRWVDLGCGKGLFTRALASYQQPGSTIYAVDTDYLALETLTDYQEVTIETLCCDFIRDEWYFYDLDGILMANSLHYVQDKPTFIQRAIRHLNESGVFLLVEYDTETANPWVPYPISFKSLTRLFGEAGFHSVEKLRERPSLYGRANLYSAFISK
ncbi:class I SAM-dependent methyltransferase [Spirosoma endbachense]|uniref:Methyltransferase domain-containing protein n=1 Tax=Spirosoma endbachense TaxID=2666025 RepID=A0A6P1VWU0_9BACT|nr:methyltransferase domain-containing protein [Spirosoma endbachense]QHV97671.1 methyltransferase domain-containing protein [Spirosoma endbachense]